MFAIGIAWASPNGHYLLPHPRLSVLSWMLQGAHHFVVEPRGDFWMPEMLWQIYKIRPVSRADESDLFLDFAGGKSVSFAFACFFVCMLSEMNALDNSHNSLLFARWFSANHPNPRVCWLLFVVYTGGLDWLVVVRPWSFLAKRETELF